MEELFVDAESAGAKRVMAAMLQMKKIDIAGIRRAYAGTA
jgi:predicted 3-demethylubiquinone-9 3-methyltransferase (glyoxalase superfamily)